MKTNKSNFSSVLHCKFILIILCFPFSTVEINAQLDSLNQLLATATTWKEKLEAHNHLSVHFRNRDTSIAVSHLNAMDEIARSVNEDYAYFSTARAKGSYYSKISDYSKSRVELNKALNYAYKLEDDKFISSCVSNIGILKFYQNDYDSAQYFLKIAYDTNKSIKDISKRTLFSNLNSLAVVSRKNYKFEDAIKFQFEALNIAQELNDELYLLSALNSMGGLYDALENFEKALSYDNQVLAIAEKSNNKGYIASSSRNIGLYYLDAAQDSALYYFKKSLDNYKSIGNQIGVIESNTSIGEYYYHQNQFSTALEYFQRARKISTDINDEKLLSNILLFIAKIHIEKNEFSSAESYLLQGLEIDEKIDDQEAINISHRHLMELYEKNKLWEQAFIYSKKHKKVNDTLNVLKYNETVKSLELEFETAKKDDEIEKQSLKIQRQTTQRNAISAGSILFISLLSLIFWNISQRNKKKQLVLEHASEINAQQIMQLEKENKILSMSSMIEGQESERKRIAQDLHDGLGGLLASIKVKFGIIQKEIAALESMNVRSPEDCTQYDAGFIIKTGFD